MVAGNILFANKTAFSGVWCFNSPEKKDFCEIVGTNGKISFNVFSTHSFILETGGTSTTCDFDDLQHVQQPMIESVVNYFLNGGYNPCTGKEGAEVMRWMEEMVKR